MVLTVYRTNCRICRCSKCISVLQNASMQTGSKLSELVSLTITAKSRNQNINVFNLVFLRNLIFKVFFFKFLIVNIKPF